MRVDGSWLLSDDGAILRLPLIRVARVWEKRSMMFHVIDEIRAKIAAGLFEFSKHATDQVILRRISVQGLREAIDGGEIIEDYPNDKYGPSCLIFG